jgi:hypothetical protein
MGSPITVRFLSKFATLATVLVCSASACSLLVDTRNLAGSADDSGTLPPIDAEGETDGAPPPLDATTNGYDDGARDNDAGTTDGVSDVSAADNESGGGVPHDAGGEVGGDTGTEDGPDATRTNEAGPDDATTSDGAGDVGTDVTGTQEAGPEAGGDAGPTCGTTNTTTNCGACGVACDTMTGTPSCNGTACTYMCNPGRSDCNGGSGSDTDGCECPTVGCCGAECQTVHDNGMGQNYYDCNPLSTYEKATAIEACVAYATTHGGQASNCTYVPCGSNTDLDICFNNGAPCWEYAQPSSPGLLGKVVNFNCPPQIMGSWN